MEIPEHRDNQGDILVTFMLEEVSGLRAWPRWAEHRLAGVIDTISEDRQQQPVLRIVDIQKRLPGIKVELHGAD